MQAYFVFIFARSYFLSPEPNPTPDSGRKDILSKPFAPNRFFFLISLHRCSCQKALRTGIGTLGRKQPGNIGQKREKEH